MLQVYADESGNKGPDQAFVVAGLVAEFENWERFSEKWSRLRGTAGPFKMREEKSRSQNWLSRYCELIKKYAKYRVETAVCIQDYEDIMRGNVPPEVDSHYFFAFHRFIAHTCAGLERRGRTEQVDFFFDKNLVFGDRANKWFSMAADLIPKSQRGILPTEPKFRDDKGFMPLQAADMFSWLVRVSYNDDPISNKWANKLEWLIKEIPSSR
jgi:hypothetical protein